MNLSSLDMDSLIGIGIIILALWILWKTRRIIWFLLLFGIAFFFLVGSNIYMDELKEDIPWLGPALLILGATYTAYKFAKKRS